MFRKPVWYLIALVMGLALVPNMPGATVKLVAGGEASGDIVSADASSIVLKKGDGSFDKIGWTNIQQSTIKELANHPVAKRFAKDFLDEDEDQAPEKRKPPEIKFKEPPRLDRPDKKAGFGVIFRSSVGVTLFALLYLANLYAGYEIGLFRNYHPGIVCGVAAVLPVIGPAIFLCVPTRLKTAADETEELVTEGAVVDEAPVDAPAEEVVPAGPAAPDSPYPPAQIYQRGQFTFNRRFFETKMAGFLRVVPSDAEKDLVIDLVSGRGNHTAQRIAKVLPNEVVFLVFKGTASSELGVPYTEIKEIKIRHKDMPV